MIKKKDTYLSDYTFISQLEEYHNLLLIDKSNHTIASYLSSIDRFFDFIAAESFESIQNITTGSVRKYLAFLKESGLQASSINAHLRPLKTFFKWLVENGHLSNSPFDNVKYLKQTKKNLTFLSAEEMQAMIEACKNLEEKTILAVMLSLGLRRSELVNLKVSDIREDKVSIIGKGSKGRVLFLPDNVLKLINRYIRTKKHGDSIYVFPSPKGGNYTTEGIRLKIKRIAKRAGIDEERVNQISPHTLRRTFATNLVGQDVNLRVIQSALGHSSIKTTMLYAQATEGAIKNAMKNQKIFEG